MRCGSRHCVLRRLASLQILNNKSRSTTATVANSSDTNLGLLLAEDGSKSGDNTGTRAAERVADGDSTAKDVDLFGVEAEDLHVGESNDREGLVDLVVVDVSGGEASVLEGLGDGEGRGGSEALRFLSGVAPAEDLGEGLDAELLDLGLGHEDDGSSAVVDGGGVGSGNGTAIRLESGAHDLELLDVEVLNLIVAVDLHGRLPPSSANLNRVDLGGKDTSLGGSLSPLVGLDSVSILGRAVDAVVVGAELALHTHVFLLKGVGETVLEDGVDKGLVAVLGAVAEVGEVVRRVGHGFGAACDDDGRVAGHDVLGADDDGFEAGGADFADGRADDGVGEAGIESALPDGGLTETGEEGILVSAKGRGKNIMFDRINWASLTCRTRHCRRRPLLHPRA